MTTDINIQLFKWIHAGAGTHSGLTALAVFFAKSGPFVVAILFAAIWFFVSETKKMILLEAFWTAVLGLIANQAIGLFYFHPRPFMMGLCTPLIPHVPETSFPSDHVTILFSAACYVLAARRWVSFGLPLLVLSCLTAWGRIYCGVHFPLDMAGSLVVALLAVAVIRMLSGRLVSLNRLLLRTADRLTRRWAFRPTPR